MTRRVRADAGFTLPELLVATAIMVVVTGAIFSQMNPATGSFRAQPEVADMQQRMRIGVDTLQKDLIMAGAGVYAGTDVSGALSQFFAPILPYRQGANPALDDGPGIYKTDAITLLYIPPTSAQTSVVPPVMPSTSPETKVASQGGSCPSNDPLCGFSEKMSVVIFDSSGAFDTFTITQVQINQGQGVLALQHRQQGDLSKSYGTDAKVAQIATHVYYRDSATDQLKHYDGSSGGVGVPVLDNVVGLSFEYYGDPQPPQLRRPGTDRTTTYGPQPPAAGTSIGTWPAGDNCTFQLVNTLHQPRLAPLGAANGALVTLTKEQLTDGPWCPDATNVNRFDADLLRIRRVRVSLRVQAADTSLRGGVTPGAASPFVRAGTSTGGYGYVPDQLIQFDVAPRNMNLAR